MQSYQLTDKSDVYSFGVVLLELLTGKPVINFFATEEERSLSSHCLYAMKENKMHELLNAEFKSEVDDIEVLMEVARLAKECLNMKGEDRPTMKEVAEELSRIRKIKQHPWEQEYHQEEKEALLNETSHSIETEHTNYFSLEKKAQKSLSIGR
ncbi:Wall-associated kinase family protein [Rhynchospora pubera]|nr:Wall-associated kinase family protein [Rhynchospora pubera]